MLILELIYRKVVQKILRIYVIFFLTVAIPAAETPPTQAVSCIEPAPLATRVILFVPYAIGALIYYVFGVVAQVISLALCAIALVLFIPAFFLDVLLLRWATGEWVLINAVSSLLKLFNFMDSYWKFGSEIQTKLWGNC